MEDLTSHFCLLLLVTITSIYLWRRRHLYILSWRLAGPLSLPLLGNILMVTRADWFERFNDLCAFYRKRGADLFTFWLGPKFGVVLLDPKTIHLVLSRALKKAKRYENVLDEEIRSAIIITPNLPQWRASRKLITPTFHSTVLKSYIRTFHSEASILVSKWQHRAEIGTGFNPNSDINLAMFDMIMISTLGLNPRAQGHPEEKDREFLYHFARMFQIANKRLFSSYLWSDTIARLTGLMAQQKESVHALSKSIQKTLDHIRERQERVKSNQQTPADIEDLSNPSQPFVELLLASPGYSRADDKDTIAQILNIIGAGEDTVTVQSSITLMLLGMHQDVQDKVFEEITQVLGSDPDYCPVYEDLSNLEYLEMVVKESLRLFPVAPIIGREVEEDLELDSGVTLPAGSVAFLSIFALHRSPKYYPNPNQFHPGRWTPQSTAQRPPYTFLPFSVGPRNCIGGKYATLAMKTLLARVLRSYRVLPTEECSTVEDIRFHLQLTMKLDETCQIRLEKRH